MATRHPGRTGGIRRPVLLVTVAAVAAAVLAVSAASGADALCAAPPAATIVAQPGVVTVGTAENDVIYGSAGVDRIAGAGGNDVIVGFAGNDQLSGGAGNDTLCGGEGNDQLTGGEGNDSLSGDAGDDELSGGSGDDRLFGDAGTDRLSGGEGADGCSTGGEVADLAASCETVLTTTTTMASTTTTTTTMPGTAATPAIHLGYADTLHDFGNRFVPSPWQGDPGVVFLGCTAGTTECGPAYDGGAIRIDNPPSNPPLTLTSASVVIGPCTFTPWGTFLPATAGPGQSMILTQTGLLGPPQPPPCDGRVSPADRPITNFDTSEGPFDTIDPPFSNCDPNLVPPPVITLTFSNGFALTVTDAEEVLNTGGVDRFACTGQAEGTPWTAVASSNIVRT